MPLEILVEVGGCRTCRLQCGNHTEESPSPPQGKSQFFEMPLCSAAIGLQRATTLTVIEAVMITMYCYAIFCSGPWPFHTSTLL